MSSGGLILAPGLARGLARGQPSANVGVTPSCVSGNLRVVFVRVLFGFPSYEEVVDMPLTKRQKEILDHIESFIEKNGYAPSFEEIADAFGYSSLATVHEHLSNLERKGYIRKAYNESRSIELIGTAFGSNAVELPLLGAVAAGLPIEAIEQQETLSVPPDMVQSGQENFVLRVEGESMIDEQIRDGDYIVVSSQETASDGQMVVALVGGDSATVKKLYREPDGRIRLQPANPGMVPIIEDASNVQIQGVVVGVIRKY
jgi:repressor LexA